MDQRQEGSSLGHQAVQKEGAGDPSCVRNENMSALEARSYGDVRGVLKLFDKEAAMCKSILPKGVTLQLIDHVEADEIKRKFGFDIFDADRPANMNRKGRGRGGRRPVTAQPKQQLSTAVQRGGMTGDAVGNSQQGFAAQQQRQTMESTELFVAPKRLKKAAHAERSPPPRAKEPQIPQFPEGRRGEKALGRAPCIEQDRVAPTDRSHSLDASGSHQAVTQQEKGDLQAKLDQLDNDQLDRVIDFLKLDMGDASEGQEIQLDLDTLNPSKRLALIRFVDAELRKAVVAKVKLGGDAAQGMSLNSPGFPALEPGTTPLGLGTPNASVMTPRREPDNAVPAASAAKRQLAWEACSAREVQRQSHLREVREAASVGGTPQSLTPAAAGEPLLATGTLLAVPDLALPPAAVAMVVGDSSTAQATAAPPPGAAAPAPVEVAPAPTAKQASLPPPGAAAPTSVGTSGDSMLESTAEVLSMVDFGW
eukprot:CAMPEP_0172799974 /NCGR_PEP_ID=MMETSP1075-20121228/2243_1 /TAXON_ID=2916 /ORGANISM="Ceratium fusus, Strain PA161109" /LENGTH=478 /DNA_ID=CAMNT_0013637775 /DNA_START=72 /DNA_END=1505 /DNA_ORIENTATION=+